MNDIDIDTMLDMPAGTEHAMRVDARKRARRRGDTYSHREREKRKYVPSPGKYLEYVRDIKSSLRMFGMHIEVVQ